MGRSHKSASIILAVLLILQAVVFHTTSRAEAIPLVKPMREFPTVLQDYQMKYEGVIEQEVQDVLRADDLLTRDYARGNNDRKLNLFVAYFQSQRTGKAPHSPRNCLPGNGWTPTESRIVELSVGDRSIPINRYVIARGESKSLVIYWYQSHNRVIASEYWAKLYLVLDSMRYNRSDTALVRIVVPIVDNQVDEAAELGESFAKAVYPVISGYLPPA